MSGSSARETRSVKKRVRIEHEHYIPVAKHKISAALVAKLHEEQGDVGAFQGFLRLIESIYHFEYHRIIEEIKQDYCLFEPGADTRELEGLSKEELEVGEERFITNFLEIMARGNFTLLTQADIEVAEGEAYLFNLPIVIDWDRLDSELLTRYFSKNRYGEEGDEPPEFANRILIFKRGVGVDRTEGRFLAMKTEILIGRFARWLVAKVSRLLSRGSAGDGSSASGDAGPATRSALREKSHIHDTRYVTRVTVKNSFSRTRAFFRRLTIQEPTYERLVILFRLAPPRRKRRKADPPPRDPTIHIKTFRDIPMADLEVIFPEKKLSMQIVDRIKIGATAAAGVGIVAFKFVTAALSPLLLALTAGGLVSYGSKTFLGWKRAKDRYQSLVTHSLYHKSLTNYRGVLFYLIDSLEEQEFKEAVLAYFFLWRRGAMTENELDATCETFLHNQFQCQIDFEVDDALDKLLREGLVAKIAGDKYQAVSIEEALRILDHKWDHYFEFSAG